LVSAIKAVKFDTSKVSSDSVPPSQFNIYLTSIKIEINDFIRTLKGDLETQDVNSKEDLKSAVENIVKGVNERNTKIIVDELTKSDTEAFETLKDKVRQSA